MIRSTATAQLQHSYSRPQSHAPSSYQLPCLILLSCSPRYFLCSSSKLNFTPEDTTITAGTPAPTGLAGGITTRMYEVPQSKTLRRRIADTQQLAVALCTYDDMKAIHLYTNFTNSKRCIEGVAGRETARVSWPKKCISVLNKPILL